MSGASRHQHDTLDQIREHLEAIRDRQECTFEHRDLETVCKPDDGLFHCDECKTRWDAVAALAKFDALLAEGTLVEGPQPYYVRRGESALCIDLLVGVGCGNAKKDTP